MMRQITAMFVATLFVGACGGGAKQEKEPPAGGRVMAPTPDQPRVQAGITDVRPNSLGTMVTVDAGSDRGVAEGWSGTILDPGDRPLGTLQIMTVTSTSSIGRTSLSADEVPSNAMVVLSPPSTD
jgi:hypothetical protein